MILHDYDAALVLSTRGIMQSLPNTNHTGGITEAIFATYALG
jgi:hypothetical protein